MEGSWKSLQLLINLVAPKVPIGAEITPGKRQDIWWKLQFMGILVAKKRTILKIAQMLSNVGVNISDHKRHVLRFLIKVMTVSRLVI